MKAKTKVYLCGKKLDVSIKKKGISFNKAIFEKYRMMLIDAGYEIMKIYTEAPHIDGEEWINRMKGRAKEIALSDIVLLLPSWRDSPESIEEVKIADFLFVDVLAIDVFIEQNNIKEIAPMKSDNQILAEFMGYAVCKEENRRNEKDGYVNIFLVKTNDSVRYIVWQPEKDWNQLMEVAQKLCKVIGRELRIWISDSTIKNCYIDLVERIKDYNESTL